MLLASEAMVGETWMRATILRQRAAVYAVDRQVPAAQDDVTAALSISPDDVDALILQARLRAMSGEHERAFLDIRRLHILAPHVRSHPQAAIRGRDALTLHTSALRRVPVAAGRRSKRSASQQQRERPATATLLPCAWRAVGSHEQRYCASVPEKVDGLAPGQVARRHDRKAGGAPLTTLSPPRESNN